MPLVKPLPADQSEDTAQLAAFFETTLGFVPNSVRTMQRRPEIAKAFMGLNRSVMDNHGRLSSEQKRLIALLVSANNGCRYCQAHTALAATRFGASADRIEALWDFQSSDLFSDAERAAFHFALASSCVPRAVDEQISAELSKHWDDGEIVEIVGVISLFEFLNCWNDTMSTSLEDSSAEAGATLLKSKGWEPGKHI